MRAHPAAPHAPPHRRHPIQPGTLIVEFGGWLHVSLRPAEMHTEIHTADYPDHSCVTGRTAELWCECGVTCRWGMAGRGETSVYYYTNDESSLDQRCCLVIARTPLSAPPCIHWLRAPLQLQEPAGHHG